MTPVKTASGKAQQPGTSVAALLRLSNHDLLRRPLAQTQAGVLQRKCACQATTSDLALAPPLISSAARGLTVNRPGDQYEQEADRIADQVMRMPDREATQQPSSSGTGNLLQRKCSECEEEEKNQLQRKEAGSASSVALPIVQEVLSSPGQPLNAATRAFMEPRLGHDFSKVRIHTGDQATRSAQAVNARAYTVGSDMVFDANQYVPGTSEGRRLLAHELTHVVQQGHAPWTSYSLAGEISNSPSVLQRQAPPASSGGGAAACSPPAHCPSDFCTPYSSRLVAQAARTAYKPIILAGIRIFVNSRVVPLWEQYIDGGAAPQDLSPQFGADFTASPTTGRTTDFLGNALRTNLEISPPTFPPGMATIPVDIAPRIPSELSAIDTPGGPNEMNFTVPSDIAGNLAGGIGKDEAACPVGAMPSPFNDDRLAGGTAQVTQNPDGSLTVVPSITFTVHDTIDLCPGDCGTPTEQIATVRLSRLEASGISGDVPFIVRFASPPRTFVAHPAAPSAPTPITGEIIASHLRIRQASNTASTVLGTYPLGSLITIFCQTPGTNVEGNSIWDQTDRGFVSDRYVRRNGSQTPPNC
jgi:hypothetical protein